MVNVTMSRCHLRTLEDRIGKKATERLLHLLEREQGPIEDEVAILTAIGERYHSCRAEVNQFMYHWSVQQQRNDC